MTASFIRAPTTTTIHRASQSPSPYWCGCLHRRRVGWMWSDGSGKSTSRSMPLLGADTDTPVGIAIRMTEARSGKPNC